MQPQWPLREARNRLGHLVAQAQHSGPQSITVRGEERAVLLSVHEYRRLTRPSVPLSVFFRQSPLVEVDLEVERGTDTGCQVDGDS
jgi:prevent-host-death family protein